MAVLQELQKLLSQLYNPRVLAHLLEPLLFWGILIGTIAWILSLTLAKDRKAQVCSLLLLAVSSFAVLPLLHFRKKAAPLTAPSSSLLNKQEERRRETRWVYYTLGSLSVLGLFMTGEGKGKAGTFLTVGLAVGGIATSVFSLWLHEKEISIFHPDAKAKLRAVVQASHEFPPV